MCLKDVYIMVKQFYATNTRFKTLDLGRLSSKNFLGEVIVQGTGKLKICYLLQYFVFHNLCFLLLEPDIIIIPMSLYLYYINL